ncbi:hypothetical protein BH18ACT4_BH18ACT4_03780 [soil metagenome]
MRVAVEQVIQTASMVLEGRLTEREAVTIFATLSREAVPAARELRTADPDQADTYRELVLALGRELRRTEQQSNEPVHRRALTEDLAVVLRALG